MTVENKLVLITGISSGVGLSVAKYLLSQNFKVVGLARKSGKVEKNFKNNSNLYFYKIDLSNTSEVRNTIKKIRKKFIFIPYIINNAATLEKSDLNKIRLNDLEYSMKVNFYSSFLFIQKLIPEMIKNNFGRIINITSGAPLNCLPNFLAYSVSKSALNTLTITFANELKGSNVKINLMSPGPVKSNMNKDSKITPEICHNLISFLLNKKKNCPNGKFFWINRELPLFPDLTGINWLKGKADNTKFPIIKK